MTETTGTTRTTRAERMAMPLARQVVRDLAVEHGACIRPVQLRRTNLDTGRGGPGARPLRAHPGVGLPVVRRAGSVAAGRAVPGRLAPRGRTRPHPRPGHRGPAMVGRAARRSPAATRHRRRRPEQDTTDFDALITELDEEIAKAGIRGKVNPGPAGPAAPLDPAPPGCPGPAPPQGHPPDGRQDLHRAGRQDVPARRCSSR